MKETLQQFTERMSKVHKEDEVHIGPRGAGHSRATFKFEGQYCYLESYGFSTFEILSNLMARAAKMAVSKPDHHWWTDYMSYGKRRANKIAKYYNAELWEAPYARESGKWFCYTFKEFEDLMRFVFDRHTGTFIKTHGKEPTPYISCFDDREHDMNVIA